MTVLKKTSPKKRPTLVQRARKKLRKEWEERRKLEKEDLTKQEDKIRKIMDKIKMEKQWKKNITDHMKDTGNKRDYTEKLAGKLLNYYYELSYPDR